MEWFGGGWLRARRWGEDVPAFPSRSSEFALTRATLPHSKASQVLFLIIILFREPGYPRNDKGYREIAPLDEDETAEARILWRHLQIAIWLMQRDPQPKRSWAERPFAMFLEIMRFLLE